MLEEEQPRYVLLIKMGVLSALNDLISLTPGKMLNEVNGDMIGNTATAYEREMTALGTDGITEPQSLPPPSAPAAPPVAPTAPVATAPVENFADNVQQFPAKACPKCDLPVIKWSDAKGGYFCPSCNVVNPKAGLFKRALGGLTDTTTTAAAATGAIAGAGVGLASSVGQAQANLAQAGQQMTMAAPPPVGDPNSPDCPKCGKKGVMDATYNQYACYPCKEWLGTGGT